MAMNFEVKFQNFEDFEVGGKLWDRIEILGPQAKLSTIQISFLIFNLNIHVHCFVLQLSII
jgi:hypothetical protein